MIDCAYIGDSIAVGLHQLDTKCAIHAKIGADTDYIVKHFIGKGGDAYTVISMGSNWPNNPHNYENAFKLRRSLKSKKVIWILPYNREAATAIKRVVEIYNDSFVDLSGISSKDRVHPDYTKTHPIVKEKLK